MHLHSIVINEFLREVVDYTFDPTPKAFTATCFARLEFAANLVTFAFCAYTRVRSECSLIQQNLQLLRNLTGSGF